MVAAAQYALTWMNHEEAEIARGLRRRDPELLDRLIEQYQHRLLRYLVYLTGDRSQAEDFFQETWVRVMERGHQYDGHTKFITWLLAIARNLVIDQMRRRSPLSLDQLLDTGDDQPGLQLRAPGATPLEQIAERESARQVNAALQELPASYREVLLLRFQEELKLEEIAALTHAPLSTVKSRLRRGVMALQPIMGKGGGA